MAEKNQERGAVKDPEHDARLKENSGGDSTRQDGQIDHRHENHGQGAVKKPDTDGRLKQNR